MTSTPCRCHWLVIACLAVVSCGVKAHPYPPLPGTEPEPTSPPPVGGGGTGAMTTAPVAGGTGGGGGTGGSVGSPVAGAGGAGGGDPAVGGSDARVTAEAGTPPPASGAGITIQGKFIPKERAVVFIHVGHSDMAGRASGPRELFPYMFDTHPQLFVYSRGGSFQPAKEPLTAGDDGSAGKSGPGMAILRTALMRAPEATFISIGHGHSGSTIGFCPNFRKGKPLYPETMAAAMELKGKVTFGGLFVMFGITEYHTGMQGLASTGDCILGLINEVRSDLGVPDLPLMVGNWNEGGTGIYAPNGMYGRIVKPQLEMLPMRDPRTGLISTMGLQMQDDRHLNMAGQKLWAERAFMVMAERGFLGPWAAP
jgi:hypothetical protein